VGKFGLDGEKKFFGYLARANGKLKLWEFRVSGFKRGLGTFNFR